MIRIITAIGNQNLNEELKKNNEFNVIGNDIIYFNGIIELLEKNKEINYLILGNNFNINLFDAIDKIKETSNKIKIILVLNRGKNLSENELFKKGILEIFYDDEKIDNLINYLKTKNIEYLNSELRNEIEDLKKIILNKNNDNLNKKNNKKMIIGISGTSGIGKTCSCILFAKSINKNNKVLIIDFDLINSHIGELYNKNINYSKINEKNIASLIFSVEKNIDIMIGLNNLYNYNKINFDEINKTINSLKDNYDYIFIDTNMELNLEINKYIYKLFDSIILLSGINKLEKIKSKKIIDTIKNKCEINEKIINIIIYRINFFELFIYYFNKAKYEYFNDIKIIRCNKKYLFF